MKTATVLIMALLVCAMAGIGALGCNTIRGVGKDVQKGGEAIEDAADNASLESGSPSAGQPRITSSAESGGSISPWGTKTVPYGSDQTFTATADAGYRVANFVVDGRSVVQVGTVADLFLDGSSSYTFDNVTANHVISASFALN